jgi:hypothetical protein
MGFFKIRNITDRLGKRHSKKDTAVVITFNDGVSKKECRVNVGDNFLIKTNNLPISIHKLRAQNLISVVSINENEFNKDLNKQKVKVTSEETEEEDSSTNEESKLKSTTKKPKRTYRKKSSASKKSEEKKEETVEE